MIVALLSWYDENPQHLSTTVLSLKKAGVGHLVAVDGAYAMFPGGERHSDGAQHLAIQYAAAELGIGLTLHAPRRVWQGNEVEKRNALFALGWVVADEGDWFLVIDADEAVSRCPDGFLRRLADLDADAANITLHDTALAENPVEGMDPEGVVIRLYRAQPIVLEGNHWTHHRPDGRILNGRPDMVEVVPADLTGFRLDHRKGLRSIGRMMAQGAYYDAMAESAEERLDCACGNPGVALMPMDWHLADDGSVVADFKDVCGECAERITQENRDRLLELGRDPNQYQHAIGRAPGARRVIHKL